jgi:hypothetical protein
MGEIHARDVAHRGAFVGEHQHEESFCRHSCCCRLRCCCLDDPQIKFDGPADVLRALKDDCYIRFKLIVDKFTKFVGKGKDRFVPIIHCHCHLSRL